VKTIMPEKNIIMKKTLVICCLTSGWFMNCVSAPVNTAENNSLNLNGEYPGNIYFDKRQRFSIVIPKDWEIEIESDNEFDDYVGLIFFGPMRNPVVALVLLNISLSVSELVDGLFIEAARQSRNIFEPQRGNISIGTTDLQVNQRGDIDITTTYLQGEYIKLFEYRESDEKRIWRKTYYIPHRRGDSIMMIICATLLPDDDNDADLDTSYDKFVKTFNWIR